jgi:GGDEF domain-containing protein
VPALVRQWASANAFPLLVFSRPEEVEAIVLRGHPCLLFVDGNDARPEGVNLVTRLKLDAFTAIVPVTVLAADHHAGQVQAWFGAGADEVITGIFSPAEQRARLDAMLVRTERDVSVHPSTRLPGTTEIEREIRRRLESEKEFAVCYADLDHFKEFNDRYSYYDGDRVIYLLSRILHDVVKGLLAQRGFVGHIGGDDFIFVVPTEEISPVCSEILDVFDTLIPLQYNEQDRRAGYFFGKDRRGQLHRVPLMTLSIGIVTNRHRQFAHPAQVSELATEMKSYAKTLPGSVFVVDRRQGTNGEERSGAGSREQP